MFDLSFDYFGDATGTDHSILRGSFAERAVTMLFLQNAVIRAAFTLGRPKEQKALVELIRSRRTLDQPEYLADTSLPLPTGG